MNYNVDHFIAKFEATKEEEWCTEALEKEGLHCALGMCSPRAQEGASEARQLNELLKYCAASINDRATFRYQQPTPRQRILAALYDVKEGKFK